MPFGPMKPQLPSFQVKRSEASKIHQRRGLTVTRPQEKVVKRLIYTPRGWKPDVHCVHDGKCGKDIVSHIFGNINQFGIIDMIGNIDVFGSIHLFGNIRLFGNIDIFGMSKYLKISTSIRKHSHKWKYPHVWEYQFSRTVLF